MSLALPPAEFFVGVDWAAEVHAVCVINIEGNVLSQFSVEHSADGIALLVHRLANFGEPIDIPIGIERPDGRLVDLLLEAEYPAVPVSPNAIKSWRQGKVLSKASGKHQAVHLRWACNKRFRVAITTFADNSRPSPWAATIYSDARTAHKDHPQAVRILACAWIRVSWRYWHDNPPYAPTKHGAAQALTAQSVNLAA